MVRNVGKSSNAPLLESKVEKMPVILPAEPGSYVLRLLLPGAVRLSVGRLGIFDFPAGEYLYLGSARGPGGLRGRIKHHLRVTSRPRWHIDYLRQHTRVMGGWYSLDPGDLECAWSKALCCLPEASIPAVGFGSADCENGCPAHLLAFLLGLPAERVMERLMGPHLMVVLPFAAPDEL